MSKIPKLKIHFPFVESFADYCSITWHGNVLNDIFINHVEAEEVAFCDGTHWGLFYIGRRPNKKTILKMLAKYGVEEQDTSDYF
jgi:hypothetical protein